MKMTSSYVGRSYMKPNLQPDDIAPWLNDFKEGKLKPFYKSQPIPEANDEPVKVVVADNLQDMVLNSKKNGSFFAFN
nr:protein disulfide-isomerase-like [Tanacetum cinerariifolium]